MKSEGKGCSHKGSVQIHSGLKTSLNGNFGRKYLKNNPLKSYSAPLATE